MEMIDLPASEAIMLMQTHGRAKNSSSSSRPIAAAREPGLVARS
jgi:hypothetical protein